MRRIVLDHLRRHVWVLVIGALLQGGIGFGQAYYASRNNAGSLDSLQLQIGVFLGSFLLLLDLQKGIARVAGALPLTAVQLGRGWWLATVAVPAAGLFTTHALGTALFHGFHPDRAIAWTPLAATALSLLLILGAGFTLMLKAGWGFGEGRGWQRVLGVSAGILWGLMIGGGAFLFRNLSDHPLRLIVLLVVGVALTVLGWFQAESLVLGRTGYRPAPGGGAPAAKAHRPEGLGGLWLILGQRVAFTVLLGVAILLFTGVFAWFQKTAPTWPIIVRQITSLGNSSLLIVIFISFLPTVQQLRHLRTLPLSAKRLTLVLLGTLLLPQIVLATLVAILGATVPGGASASGIVQSSLLTLGVSSLWPAFMAWRGPGMASIFVVVLTAQFGAVWMRLSLQFFTHPLGLTALITAGALAAGFFLTRLALVRGTRAYRVPTGAFAANPAWGMGR